MMKFYILVINISIILYVCLEIRIKQCTKCVDKNKQKEVEKYLFDKTKFCAILIVPILHIFMLIILIYLLCCFDKDDFTKTVKTIYSENENK